MNVSSERCSQVVSSVFLGTDVGHECGFVQKCYVPDGNICAVPQSSLLKRFTLRCAVRRVDTHVCKMRVKIQAKMRYFASEIESGL